MDLISSTTPNSSSFIVTLLFLYVATAFLILLAVPAMAMAGERGTRRRRRGGLSIHVTEHALSRHVLVRQSAALVEHPPQDLQLRALPVPVPRGVVAMA
ncbi:unnamed protein product [Urochloa decumbens]|uniref:Uncharacterized protein n=1 Tax=Urochloa decumbens TaxID=240449 RepID=A0ABC9AWX7_9POAL